MLVEIGQPAGKTAADDCLGNIMTALLHAKRHAFDSGFGVRKA